LWNNHTLILYFVNVVSVYHCFILQIPYSQSLKWTGFVSLSLFYSAIPHNLSLKWTGFAHEDLLLCYMYLPSGLRSYFVVSTITKKRLYACNSLMVNMLYRTLHLLLVYYIYRIWLSLYKDYSLVMPLFTNQRLSKLKLY